MSFIDSSFCRCKVSGLEERSKALWRKATTEPYRPNSVKTKADETEDETYGSHGEISNGLIVTPTKFRSDFFRFLSPSTVANSDPSFVQADGNGNFVP